MATHEIPILNASLSLDTSGDIYFDKISNQLTLTNAKDQLALVMEFPTGADIGFSVNFVVPQNYVGTPKLLIRGILDGSPANIMAFGADQLGRDNSESVDTAYEAADLANNSTWTGYADEDMYEDEITLTPGSAYTAGDTVYLWFYRDDSVDTTTFNFILTGLAFQYADA